MSTANSWDQTPLFDARDGVTKPPKGVENYLKALKRRFWVVLLCVFVIGGAGTIFTFYQKPVYYASSRILIEPPQAIVNGLNDDGNRGNSSAMSNFFNTRVQMITSRQIIERVMSNLKLSNWGELNGMEDADKVGELLGLFKVKPVQNSNLVDVGIEGGDAPLVARIVNSTVEEFTRYEAQGLMDANQVGRTKIESELLAIQAELNSSQNALNEFHTKHNGFLVNGESAEAARLATFEQAKAEADLFYDKAKKDVERFKTLLDGDVPILSQNAQLKAEQIRAEINAVDQKIESNRLNVKEKYFEIDPAVKQLRALREQLVQSLTDIGAEEAANELKRLEQEVEFARSDAESMADLVKQQREIVLSQQEDFQKLSDLQTRHQLVASLNEFMRKKKGEIEVGQGLVTPRIQVIDRANTPTVPIRPIKPIQIPLFIVGGMLFGCMIVVGLEFADHRIREPEHLRACLQWPLLGVIPKTDRRLLTTSDGSLKPSSESPGSQLCEAFRNLRTGILGAETQEGLRTVLVAGPKEKEGNSVVAANLAATCARAGEAVLLVDLNLRKPTVDTMFQIADAGVGLTQVLEGRAAWQQAIRETRIPNLTVLTTGDVTGVPLDILGTIEMFDLLNDLSEKFDRIILDGPGLLGLADSRVVGRFADGVLLVVRAEQHDGKPLARVRQLFEQEGLRPLGVVFNCLRAPHEDLSTYTQNSRPLPAAPTTKKQAEPVSSSSAA